MNETDIKRESAKAVCRNMSGMTDKEVAEYVSKRRAFACVAFSACAVALGMILIWWMLWNTCGYKRRSDVQAPYSVCPFCGSVLDGKVNKCVPER
jgi:cell division septal protein FtsQ